MTFFLKGAEPDAHASANQVLAQLQPSMGETFSASVEASRIKKDQDNRARRVEEEYAAEIKAQLPPEALVSSSERHPSAVPYEEIYKPVFEGVRRAKELNPKYSSLPDNIEDFEAEVKRRRQAELQDVEDVMGASDRWVASAAGEMWSAVTTPEGAASVLMGAPGGLRLAPTMLLEGGAAALDELRTIPDQLSVAYDLGTEEPQVARQVLTAGAAGAAFSGVLVGGARALGYSLSRSGSLGERRPAGTSQVSFSNAVKDAERSLEVDGPIVAKDGETAAVGTPARSGTTGNHASSPQLPAHVQRQPEPANWPQIRNGIFAGESGGDYNALFAFQNRPGGRFQNVKLTAMTVDEAIRFSSGRGDYGQWVKGQIGRVATPMGAYQIVGKTLRAVKKGMRLRGDEKMTEALQDQMGLWILKHQGTGAWEGYRGPRSSRPTPAQGDAPTYATRRGYTTTGTVSAGKDLRVDVRYEVVDLATLTRASGELQPRDRTRAASDAQVAEIASSLDPARLMPAPEADRGAPIVGPDSIVESGNGRVMALERAYERHPDRADAYRRQIEAAGYSIPPDAERPVLVARRVSDMGADARKAFVRQANASVTSRMSAPERAAADAQTFDAETLANFDTSKPLNSSANRAFARSALAGLPETEAAALVDAQGRLNAEGVSRLRQAVFAKAYDAPDIVARYAEADAGDLRSLMDALEQAAPKWASLKAAIGDGRVEPEFDITSYLLDAMRLISAARTVASSEKKVFADMLSELLDDRDLLEDAVAPLTAALVRKFVVNGRALRAEKISEFLNRYADEAIKVGSTDKGLLGDGPSPLDVLKAIDGDSFGALTELGARRVHVDEISARPTTKPKLPTETAASSSNKAISQPASGASDDVVVPFSRGEFADLEITLDDGSVWKADEVLNDIDADETLNTVIGLCVGKGGGHG